VEGSSGGVAGRIGGCDIFRRAVVADLDLHIFALAGDEDLLDESAEELVDGLRISGIYDFHGVVDELADFLISRF